MEQLLVDSVVFLAAALIAVPLSVRAGFGSVLGYLIAGVVIGPWVLRLVTDVDSILDISELGIVLMMFIIGIEMDLKKLWAMRRAIFGYGGIQVALCAALLAAIFTIFGAPWRVGVAAGFALSLSSTAMVIAILEQNREMDTPVGQTCFGILLFQDIAAIPMIALLPLLAPAPIEDNDPSGWLMTARALAMLAAVVFGGRFILQHALRIIQRSGTREIFTIFALLWVIGIALLMHVVHLSMSLGAFVAGMLLAGSESRHEIEADMAPFKGILLGLFFIAVGMSIDFRVLAERPWLVAILVVVLVGGKLLALMFLASKINLPREQRIYFAILLSQGGEFAFVVTAAAQAARLLDNEQLSIVTVVVALSMATTPLLLLAFRKLMAVQPA
ncbi:MULTISPECIES: monovalent cation:proton antiporter-2 (CPA2) family protein [Cupriavidus]|uniref:Kef-type potassium/proton antiporter, CPA2 family n=1 Tax=Cupriavidus pinatubonensis (strain JMP 134 / LMG 1197) TaxID=264198 RepID=Q470W0_CUPPJ|nr:monovalent cation:proton antiporter-2 (CPA2) family protein [Cupriavidus necator]QYY33408.1 monovalent cation:proton antiporter-2 (CPA2) family protein [Cupriavidus pinatubonensis]TPQ36859.1 cation/H(+) antiporter [Cupriavidus pinatubonensis]